MYFMPQCRIISSGIFDYLDFDLDNYDFHTVNVTSQNNDYLLITYGIEFFATYWSTKYIAYLKLSDF